jgi:hypothetical protein
MNDWEIFIDSINDEEMITCFQDYQLLERDGYLGDCFLRIEAEKWMRKKEYCNNVVFVMRDIVFCGYKRFTKRYLETVR